MVGENHKEIIFSLWSLTHNDSANFFSVIADETNFWRET